MHSYKLFNFTASYRHTIMSADYELAATNVATHPLMPPPLMQLIASVPRIFTTTIKSYPRSMLVKVTTKVTKIRTAT